jgi:hypothetical protein
MAPIAQFLSPRIARAAGQRGTTDRSGIETRGKACAAQASDFATLGEPFRLDFCRRAWWSKTGRDKEKVSLDLSLVSDREAESFCGSLEKVRKYIPGFQWRWNLS